VDQLRDEVIGSREGARSTDVGRLIAIENYLRSQQYSKEALPGHSFGAIYRTLLGSPADRFGGAEQFASAFAVLARAAGYPSRVAVGYRLTTAERDGDAFLVSTNDAHAWPEVHLQGYGWVPFEPTDTDDDVTPPPRSEEVTLDSADAAAAPAAATGAPVGEQRGGGLVGRIRLVAGLAASAVVLLLVTIVVLKWLRRSIRRRRGPPARRIVGAWREVADRLTEAGVPVPISRTGSEVARDLRGGPGATVSRQVAELAPFVASAVFAFDEPDEDAARRAWALERSIRRDLRNALPITVRARSPFDPRSLLPRRIRRVRRVAQPVGTTDGKNRTGVG
jgi:Transglutaminase-like superfamily